DNLLMARLRNVEHLSTEATPSQRAVARKAGGSGNKKLDSLIIRPPQREDAEDLHNVYRHPLVARTTLQIPSQKVTLSRQRMETLPPGLYRLVAEVDGRVVGSISLHQAQHAQEKHAAGLGMGVHPDYWSRGIGSALMSAVVDLADNWLNITRVELDVNVDNPAGVHLYKKFGFEIEGTRRFHTYGDGRWADSYFMARLRD
ncbi:MAG: GNAT family N-acetyltransferase, partial [Chloroflexota bacterium]